MITINITDKDDRLTVEVIDRETLPVSVRLYSSTVDKDADVIKKAEEVVRIAREG